MRLQSYTMQQSKQLVPSKQKHNKRTGPHTQLFHRSKGVLKEKKTCNKRFYYFYLYTLQYRAILDSAIIDISSVQIGLTRKTSSTTVYYWKSLSSHNDIIRILLKHPFFLLEGDTNSCYHTNRF